VLVGRGGIQVGTPEQLLRVARELLSRPEEILRLGVMAREAVGAVRGASARNVDHMLRAIPRGKGVP
jgi:3-deoxy-D-manno-octulosonic-acid transferase